MYVLSLAQSTKYFAFATNLKKFLCKAIKVDVKVRFLRRSHGSLLGDTDSSVRCQLGRRTHFSLVNKISDAMNDVGCKSSLLQINLLQTAKENDFKLFWINDCLFSVEDKLFYTAKSEQISFYYFVLF